MDKQTVKDQVRKIVGWNNHYDQTEIPNFTDTTLLESESGIKFNEEHPALRLDLIQACLPENRDLEEYLKSTQEEAVISTIAMLEADRINNHKAKNIVLQGELMKGAGHRTNQNINAGGFQGWILDVNYQKGLTVEIQKFGLQTTAQETDVKLYLYHEFMPEPIQIFEVSTAKANFLNFTELNIDLNAEEEGFAGGRFYLGFYEDDLLGNTINNDNFSFRTGSCASCDGGTFNRFYKQTKTYFRAQPFYVEAGDLEIDRSLFDTQKITTNGLDKTNFGINITFSVECKLDLFYVENRIQLKDVYYLNVVKIILSMMKYSQEISSISENLQDMIIRELDGDSQFKDEQIGEKIKNAVKNTNMKYDNIAPICLPCQKSQRTRIGIL